MKPVLAVTLLMFSILGSIYAETIATRGPEAAPGLKEAIDRLNADVDAWNRRCAVTNSDAEQSSCEEERSRLETRKLKLRAGGAPPSDALAHNPVVEITLRRNGGQIVKQVKADPDGVFTVGTFPAGAYNLEFRAKVPRDIENKSFVIKIGGIKSRGGDKGLLGRHFAGGASFEIQTLPGQSLHGAIAPGSVRNARKMIWLPQEIGSNLPGRWVEEGSAQAVGRYNWGHYTIEAIKKMQDHVDLGR